MSKERPILFSGPMVRAILEGRKTQTRRIVKIQPNPPFVIQAMHGRSPEGSPFGDWGLWRETGPDYDGDDIRCPYGQPGDRLWVRETWGYRGGSAQFSGSWEGGRRPYDEVFLHYAADDSKVTLRRPCDDHSGLPKQRARRDGESLDDWDDYLTAFWRKWTPSIYMPRWASRITLEIGSVRVERLQDITEEDAIAEGIEPLRINGNIEAWWDYLESTIDPCDCAFSDPRESYRTLWETINGPGSWGANPWVWVVTFKRLTP